MKYQFIRLIKQFNFRLGVYPSSTNQVRLQMNGVKQLISWIELIGFSNMKHRRKAIIFLSNKEKNDEK